MIRRVRALEGRVAARLAELRDAGEPVGRLVIACLGDLVEGCAGFYPSQTFSVEYHRRDQTKIARKLILRLVKAWSELAADVVVVAVAGNHGENRGGNGKIVTDAGDSDDLAVVECAAEAAAENPDRFGHVRWIIPDRELAVSVELEPGVLVGFAHGHMADGRARGGSATSAGKIWAWWRDQSHAWAPAGDCSILITGHYHHFYALEQGPRLHVQAPPLDDGSEWFEDRSGYASKAGTLSLVVREDGSWTGLEIL